MAVGDISCIGDLLALYRVRAISPTEVIAKCLDDIERMDKTVRAFRTIVADRASDEATKRTKQLAKGDMIGPLHGVPIAVKELFDVEGVPISYGSRVLAEHIASADADAVAALRMAGAIVVGITRSHEFGWGITTQHPLDGGTRNPWNIERVPGGSSGGSAAAVAARLVLLALGTDTGGSIRIPASFCGVAGMKPTFGSVSTRGTMPLAISFDTVGPIASRVADLALAFSVLGEQDLQTSTRPPRGPDHLRVGIAPSLNVPTPNADVSTFFFRAIALLQRQGGSIRELNLGPIGAIRAAFASIQMAEASYVHRRILGTFPSRAQDYGADVRRRLEAAEAINRDDYLAARSTASGVGICFHDAFKDVDVIWTPVSAGPPSTVTEPNQVVHHGEGIEFRDLVMNYTTPQNLTGLPVVSVPVGLDSQGLPVAVQVTGPAGREDIVLSVAAQLEAAFEMPPCPLGSGRDEHLMLDWYTKRSEDSRGS